MDVRKVATLANLPLSDEELVTYGSQLDKILKYVNQLQKIDISNTSETNQVAGLKSVGRDDKVIQHFKLIDGYFKVKTIFNND